MPVWKLHRCTSYPCTSAKTGNAFSKGPQQKCQGKVLSLAVSAHEVNSCSTAGLAFQETHSCWEQSCCPYKKAVAKVFLWLLVLQHRFLSRLLTWQCVPFCSLTSGRTMWCNYLQCKCDWTLIKEAFRFEFVLGFQYLAFNFCTNVWNELKYFQYENKICLENFI